MRLPSDYTWVFLTSKKFYYSFSEWEEFWLHWYCEIRDTIKWFYYSEFASQMTHNSMSNVKSYKFMCLRLHLYLLSLFSIYCYKCMHDHYTIAQVVTVGREWLSFILTCYKIHFNTMYRHIKSHSNCACTWIYLD